MYTTDTLIEAVQRNVSMPTSSIKYTPSDIIAFLNEELRWLIAPALANTNEQYFTERYPITLVASQSTYNLPSTASCWEFDSIYWVNTDGYRQQLPQKTRMGEGQGSHSNNIPEYFYFEDAKIHLVPNMDTSPSGSLEIVYRRLLNLLRQDSDCAVIQSVVDNGLTWGLNLDVSPLGYTNGVDFINSNNPYELFGRDVTATLIGLTMTVTKTDLDRTPVAGDIIAETGYTKVPHIPSEWHPILSVAGSLRVLSGCGDKGNLDTLKEQLNNMLTMMNQTAKNRANNSPKKIVSRNYILNASRYRWR